MVEKKLNLKHAFFFYKSILEFGSSLERLRKQKKGKQTKEKYLHMLFVVKKYYCSI